MHRDVDVVFVVLVAKTIQSRFYGKSILIVVRFLLAYTLYRRAMHRDVDDVVFVVAKTIQSRFLHKQRSEVKTSMSWVSFVHNNFSPICV